MTTLVLQNGLVSINRVMWTPPINITPPVISVLSIVSLIAGLQVSVPAVFSGEVSQSTQWQRSTDGGNTYVNISNGLNLSILSGGLVRVQVTSTNPQGSTIVNSNSINVGLL